MFRAIVGHSEDPDEDGVVEDIIDQCREQLGEDTPKAALLFAAIDYEHKVILDGINNEWPDIKLIGCTTDGEISSSIGFSEDSVTMMFFCSDSIDITTGVGCNLSNDIKSASNNAIQMATQNSETPTALCIALPDSFGSSGQEVVNDLASILGDEVPLVGGTAADQMQMNQTFQFFGRQVLSNSLPVMLFSGNLNVSISLAFGCVPIGDSGIVTKSKNTKLYEIDNLPAQNFYKKILGEGKWAPVEIPLAALNDNNGIDFLRTPSGNADDEVIDLFADLDEGTKVTVVTFERDEIIESCETAFQDAVSSLPGSAQYDAILHFSCAGRKLLLGSRTNEEHLSIRSSVVDEIPSVGFYCYGEISPPKAGGASKFHNHTSVIVLLGEDK